MYLLRVIQTNANLKQFKAIWLLLTLEVPRFRIPVCYNILPKIIVCWNKLNVQDVPRMSY